MKFSECNKNQQWAVRMMQKLGYGDICGLQIKDGQPQASPAPELWQTEKFGINKPMKGILLEDFELHKQHVCFLKHIETLKNGVLPIIQIHDGLPLVYKRKVSSGLI